MKFNYKTVAKRDDSLCKFVKNCIIKAQGISTMQLAYIERIALVQREDIPQQLKMI